MATLVGGPWPEHLNSPANTYYQSPPSDNNDTFSGDDTLGQGSFGTQDVLPSTRRWTQAEQFRANAMPSVPVPPDYITNGHGFPMQTTSCTWPYVVPVGEDPAAHGHWCTFTDLYHTIPCHSIHESVSPVLRPFGLRFSNEMCVCAGQVWGDDPCLVVWSHVDGFGLFLAAERGRWAMSVNFLMVASRPFAFRAMLNACPQFLSDPTARGCGIHTCTVSIC